MNDPIFVVVVDTRGMPLSNIDGYEEHTWSEAYFDHHVLGHPNVRCIKSKVAELCGLDMKIYFHDYIETHVHSLHDPPQVAISEEEEDLYPQNRNNGAATLLTFDPRTGFPEFKVLSKAYVVVDSGDYPLSNHQVWGLQDLISEAHDVYHCDPEHIRRGGRELHRWCKEYREQAWGPLTIYEPRVVETDYRDEKDAQEQHEYYSHRHFDNCECEQCHSMREEEERAEVRNKTPKSEKHGKKPSNPLTRMFCPA